MAFSLANRRKVESFVMGQTIDDVVSGLRQRIEELSEQVRSLNATVDDLGARVSSLTRQPFAAKAEELEHHTGLLAGTGAGERFQASTFLSTTATVCFLLVIALVLRMASDTGVIDYQVGAFLGLLYAFALFVVAHVRYSRARREVPVYSICAGVMVFAIVLENHARFTDSFAPLTYVILAFGSLIMILLGVLHSIPALIGMATLGVSVVALAAGFPNPVFPFAALLILFANIAICVRTRLTKCGWMAWGMLAVTLVFWFTWTVRLTTAINRDVDVAPALASAWFLPFLAGFVTWYLVLSVRNALRPGDPVRPFETALPVLTIVWSYPVARSVTESALFGPVTLDAVGLVTSVCLTGFAIAVANHRSTLTREAMPFLLGGLLLCGLSLPAVIGTMLGVVVVWCITGILLVALSFRWKSRSLRGISYVVQAYACGVALLAAGLLSLEPTSLGHASVGLAMAALCLGHYIYVRKRTPDDSVDPSGGWDIVDRAAIVPLLVAVIGAFGTVRLAWYVISAQFESEGAFQSGQSVLINASAILLSEVGLVKRNGDFLFLAAIVAVIGAGKVFAFDFLHIQNLPLVISVFSFGLMAALGAVIWRRWQGATV